MSATNPLEQQCPRKTTHFPSTAQKYRDTGLPLLVALSS
jgi:hypothetical protein